MARDFNQNRIANARLVSADIDKFGKTFAIQSPYNADGFSSVNVTVEQAPSDIKQYLEGDNSITIYPVPSNVDKLCEYALMSFPNIEDLYLFKTSAIVVLDDDLSYLLDLNKIYVPTDLLSAYQSAYPTIASKFDIIVEDYTLTIPFVGETTLTSEYIDSVIAMLSNAEKNAITKVVIPTDFTQESASEIAWNYDFSAIVNLDNNIWYGNNKYDFSVFTIKGSGTLTSAIVESSISSIPSSKLSGITKVVVPNTLAIDKTLTNVFSPFASILTNVKKLDIQSEFLTTKNEDFNFNSFIGNDFVALLEETNVSIRLRNEFGWTGQGIFSPYAKKQIINVYSNGNYPMYPKLLYADGSSNPSNAEIVIINDYLDYNHRYTHFGQSAGNNDCNFSKLAELHINNIKPFSWFNKNEYGGNNPFNHAGENVVGGTKIYLLGELVTFEPLGTYTYSFHLFKNPNRLFVRSQYLVNYMSDVNLMNYISADRVIGILDYTDSVPDYGTDYQATWYSDEDCTVQVLPANFVSGNRYFVKLIAI